MMENSAINLADQYRFTDFERKSFYKTVFSRRDVRGEYTKTDIAGDVLARILMAAHYAPSVGFMQPWNFIVIRSETTKKKIHGLFKKANAEAADMFQPEQQKVYKNLKLEGILEAPVNICVTCDRDRAGPVVIGRTHHAAMDVYSAVCAVENLWLAARAEGLGLGWVSIIDHKALKETLKLPKRVVPVAYLCLGYVSHFHDRPELETANWRRRLDLADLVQFDTFGGKADDDYSKQLIGTINDQQQKLESGTPPEGI